MQTTRSVQLAGALGLFLLCIPHRQGAYTEPLRGQRHAAVRATPVRTRPGSPSAIALRHAERCWGRELMAVKPAMDTLAAGDPNAAPGTDEECRRQLMARDRDGYLRQAQAAALQAVSRARTPGEEYSGAQSTPYVHLRAC